MKPRHVMKQINAVSLPSAVIFSLVAALTIGIIISSLMISDGLLSRLERREQALSAIHAACLLYCRDSSAFDDGSTRPFPGTGMEVSGREGMHGFYGTLTLDVPLQGSNVLERTYLTGVRMLPTGDCGVFVPDRGVTLTIGDGCIISSPLHIPMGFFRRLSHGRAPLDSLSVLGSSRDMPELSAAALEMLSCPWDDVPGEVVLKGNDEGMRDSLVRGFSVIVDSTFRGCVQVFARDSVTIMERARMEYPSGVCLVSDDDGAGLRIGKGAVVEGYAAILGRGEYRQEEGSVVRGLVYAPGKVYAGGSVTGSAFFGNPCYKDGMHESEYTLEGFIQNSNSVLAYPNLFAEGYGPTVIRRMLR